MKSHRRGQQRGAALPIEQDIVPLLIARNPRAVEIAYDRWGQVTYGFALALVGSPPAAEAIVQAVYLSLWRDPGVALKRHIGLDSFLLEAVVRAAHDLHYGPFGATRSRVLDQSLVKSGTSRER